MWEQETIESDDTVEDGNAEWNDLVEEVGAALEQWWDQGGTQAVSLFDSDLWHE